MIMVGRAELVPTAEEWITWRRKGGTFSPISVGGLDPGTGRSGPCRLHVPLGMHIAPWAVTNGPVHFPVSFRATWENSKLLLWMLRKS